MPYGSPELSHMVMDSLGVDKDKLLPISKADEKKVRLVVFF